MTKKTKTTTKKKTHTKDKKKHECLSECVTKAVDDYFTHLDEAETRNFYELVMQQVEVPMLTIVMREANQNQSVASQMLGLNRGTLRKKLKAYDLI